MGITDRVKAKRSRNAIVAAADQQARILESVLSSIVDFAYTFDRDGRFLYANKALLDLWGLKLENAIGKNFFDLQYPEELAAKLQRQIQQVFATRQGLSDTATYTSLTGVAGFFEYIFSPVLAADGSVEFVAGSTRNITEQRRAFEALQRSEENFRILAEKLLESEERMGRVAEDLGQG